MSKSHRHRRSSYGERHVLDHLPDIPNLTFGECIGHGHFSHVYRGTYQSTTPVAIKLIERGSEKLISTEVSILTRLRGVKHVVQLLDVIEGEQTVLVFELVKAVTTSHFLEHVSTDELRRVLRGLLEALVGAHGHNIVHRDIKMGNVLVDSQFREIRLIDWGCGTFVTDDMSTKAGSRHCRPPEMLLGYANYGFGCDVWAIGVLILYVLGGGEIPWKGRTSVDVLSAMMRYFEREEFERLSEKVGIPLPEEIEDLDEDADDLESWFHEDYADLAEDALVDLMRCLLTFDFERRPTAAQALGHPYFGGAEDGR
jgi:serine/threonine protein kinase